jgi:SAM-dependent methyltransferase
MDTASRQPVTQGGLPLQSDFDEERYLLQNPDVASAVRMDLFESGWQHFIEHGYAEGRTWVKTRGPGEAAAPRSPGIANLSLTVNREIAPGDEMLIAGNERHYFTVGKSAIHCIRTALHAARREDAAIGRILDMPCGHGRVMRFLRAAFPKAELTACDLNRDGVDFCARTFGAIPAVSHVDAERVSLKDHYDLIWCGSLLTHLPAAQWTSFLRLFWRSLNPGGILVFSSHGRRCEFNLMAGKDKYGLQDHQIATLLGDYHSSGFGFEEYAGSPGYGISLSRPDVVIGNYVMHSDWLLVGYQESSWDNHQDVIAIQRGP